MGLFDDILGQAIGTQGAERKKQSSSLVEGLLDLLDEPETGGVQGLEKRSQESGLGEIVKSWIGNGSNRSIAPDQLTSLLGAPRIEALGRSAGLTGSSAIGAIGALLPALIDKLTPDGKAPEAGEVQRRGREILRGESPHATSPARARADFSDVQAGSSTAATPSPEPESYVVVAGDSLSKISKRLYGDAKQWRRIFEANRDQIDNPDLIHPGQKLRIPRT